MQLPMAVQTENLNSTGGSDRSVVAKREFSVIIKKPCNAVLKLPSSSPTTGHVNRALWHSEQLAEAARAAGVANNQVLCNPIWMALITSSNHPGLL